MGWPQGTGLQMGGGDVLMSFLGVVILSFGFRIFGQRRLMVRHAPEIFGSTTLSAAFSLFATAAFAHAIGLAPGASLPPSLPLLQCQRQSGSGRRPEPRSSGTVQLRVRCLRLHARGW